MPSKRTSNAAKKNTGSAKAKGTSRGGSASSRAQETQTSSTTSDIVGVVLAVIAVAMLVAILVPSSAVVTSAVHDVLSLAFGVGAPLVPIALFLFAMTFFLDDVRPLSGRVAGGLALIVLAVLSMISLNYDGAADVPELVFDEAVATAAGGYVGGAVAWALLTLVGRVVGNIVLVGVIVAGLVVCGFSISGAIAKARTSISEARERRRERREQKIIDDVAAEEEAARQAENEQYAPAHAQPTSLFDDTSEAPTTYIGNRKTTVLKRESTSVKTTSAFDDTDEEATETSDGTPEARTTLLSRKRGKKSHAAEATSETAATPEASLDATSTKPQETEPASSEPVTDRTVVMPMPATAPEQSSDNGDDDVPSFLRKDKHRQTKAEAASMTSAAQTTQATDTAESAPSSERTTKAAAKVATSSAAITPPSGNNGTYRLPPFSILRTNTSQGNSLATEAELSATAKRLQATLEEFGSTSHVEGWIAGPSVTTFKVSMGEGERVSKIVNLQDDIALSLAARSVRVFAPIPGTSLVGIEIPNEKAQPVYLSDVLPYAKGGPLECAFGRDSEGKPIIVDLAELPHLLVAGTTGSGKSVLLNSIVMSMLMRDTPEQVRLIMIDPKRVEFTAYDGLPHLYVPVVTEPKQAASALQWSVTEMERRLKVFEHYKVRDIKTYNRNVDSGRYDEMENPPKHMPYFVIVIDELADLMLVAGKDVESSIVRIAQLGRAAGIHLIVATQRPSADVVTGLIRANIDNRVALSVDNSLNSRIILDQKGAEQLLGKGDMLIKLRGKKPRRAQGCWVSDEEIEATVAFIREQAQTDYHEDILTTATPAASNAAGSDSPKEEDPLLWEAAQIVVDSQLGSTSGLQRSLSVGYARAGRIMDMLEAKGVVGPANGSKPREVLIDQEGLEELKAAEEAYKEVV